MNDQQGGTMRVPEYRPSCPGRIGVRPGSVRSLIVQAIRDLVAAECLPYTVSIARLVGRSPSQVNRELQELLRRGRVVKGERVGSIVPYYPAGE